MKIDTQSKFPIAGSSGEVKEPENPELRKVAKQFEAVFINQMIGAMRKTVPQGGLIPESNAERTFKSMLDSENAARIADAEQLGLSALIYEHLLRSARGQ
jgi:flagellar protein FlgJ